LVEKGQTGKCGADLVEQGKIFAEDGEGKWGHARLHQAALRLISAIVPHCERA
jgi:hypothetical protein